jgi:hypothetical protein
MIPLNKAIDRLYFRIKNGMPKANQTDLDAVNSIVEYLNESQKQTIKENIPFTKMYVHLFGMMLDKYGDVYLAQNELNRILVTPTLEIYEKFSDKLNHHELLHFLEFHDIELKHPAIETETEREANLKIISENKEQFLKHAFGLRDFDNVRQQLNTQVALAFNKYQLKK